MISTFTCTRLSTFLVHSYILPVTTNACIALYAASYDDGVYCDMHYYIDLCPKWEPFTQYINSQCCRDSGNESDSEVNEHLRGLEINWLTSDKL
jgi:hypothetical protein